MSEVPYGLLLQVRLLIGDTDKAMFDDHEIAAFMALNPGSARRSAAQALDVIAVSEALLSKKITSQDLATDGPAVAEALRKQAAALRAQADEEEAAAGGAFDVVEWPYGQARRPELTEPSW